MKTFETKYTPCDILDDLRIDLESPFCNAYAVLDMVSDELWSNTEDGSYLRETVFYSLECARMELFRAKQVLNTITAKIEESKGIDKGESH